MSVTSALFRAARISATMRAASRGPASLGFRLIRIVFGRAVIGPLWRTFERIIRL